MLEIILITNRSSGHINNLLRLSNDLINVNDEYSITFISSGSILEKQLIPKNFNVIEKPSLFKIYKYYKEKKVACIISSGGGFSFKPLLLGYVCNIPSHIIDPNYVPGQATLLFSNLIKTFGCASEYSKYFKNFILIENPINLKIKNDNNIERSLKKSILIIGGSQGNKRLTNCIVDNIDKFAKYQVHLILGKGTDLNQLNLHSNMKCYDYVEDIYSLYNKVDLVISSSGANSINELLFLKKPFLLYPLIPSKDDHQIKNALHINRYIKDVVYTDSDKLIKQSLKILENPRILNNYQQELNKISYSGNTDAIIKNLDMKCYDKFSFSRLLYAVKMIFFGFLKLQFLLNFDKSIIAFKKKLGNNYINYDEIPQFLVRTLLVIEDGGFMYHNGYPYREKTLILLFRGIFNKLGYSGIVQQLIKNLFYLNLPSKFYNFKRKINELILTYFINKFYSKQQILEYYFNILGYIDYKMNYISNFGIINLSQKIFKKKPNELTKFESILLSVIINNIPKYYNTNNLNKEFGKRKNFILNLIQKLVILKLINQEEKVILEQQVKEL